MVHAAPSRVARAAFQRLVGQPRPPRRCLAASNLKSWLQGTERGVSGEHLQAYLDDYTFRFNRRRTPMAAFQTLLGLQIQQRPPPTAASSQPAGRPGLGGANGISKSWLMHVAGHDLVHHCGKVGADDVGSAADRAQDHARPCDERGLAARG